MEKPFITLTTDFGLKDPFAGIMKGVILGINPNATITDITHNISRHNILEASFIIPMSCKYFPKTSIHIAVIDPGVGSSRRPILVMNGSHYFIGPDNGIFSRVYDDAPPHFLKVIHLTASHYFLPMTGSTFHGRDIFAPVAAWISKGVHTDRFGEPVDDYVKISTPKPVVKDKSIKGEVIMFDHFGNAITNITESDIARHLSPVSAGNFTVTCKEQQISLMRFYSEKKRESLSAVINSFNCIELFVFEGNASEKYNINIGDTVSITTV